MKSKLIFSAFFLCVTLMYSQYNYEPSTKHPYGLPNPNAPSQIKDFNPMIGTCNCKSTNRKPDGTWNEPVDMTWTFKYIMNGYAVQDETLKADGNHSGSIRQFSTDSSRWYVHYYASSSPSTILPVWEGNRTDDAIVLYKDQKAPNGMEGDYRLTFYDFSDKGYKWIGEWVDKKETVVFPTWKIECVRPD